MPPHDKEPSAGEALLVMFSALAIELIMITRHREFWDAAAGWLDNRSYINITLSLLGRKAPSSMLERHFWGLPYLTAAISAISSASILFSLVAISIAAALCTTVLTQRLYGGWVATVFAAVSIEWLRLSLLGGSEPLFVCLLLASFLAVRSNFWIVAVILAGIAATVRPVGVIALVSIAAVMIVRRKWKMIWVSAALAAGIAGLYVLPIYLLTGDPLINFERYRSDWRASGSPIGTPFLSMMHSYQRILVTQTWINSVRYIAWPLALLGSLALVISSKARMSVLKQHPAETLFAGLYLAFLASYITDASHLQRFVLPVLPTILSWLNDVLPKSKWFVYCAVMLSAVFAGS